MRRLGPALALTCTVTFPHALHMGKINDAILAVRTVLPETVYGKADQTVKIGDTVADFSISLSLGSTVLLSDLLAKGSVVINFIKGTWCPYCQLHLRSLREWQESVNRTKKGMITIIVISNESLAVIRSWLKSNPVPYLFGSDESGELAKIFGVELTPQEFLKPATFLIDGDRKIKMAYAGRRKDLPTESFISSSAPG